LIDFYLYIVYSLTFIGLFATFFYILNIRTHFKKKNLPSEAEDKSVSIIIPAYNEEKSIAKTIDSALALEYPSDKLEILVVDDGSKDNTLKIAKTFQKNTRFPVRVFSKANGGKGSALNFGIERAKNEIIVSMDADSYVEVKTLKRMVALFYSEKVMAVTSSMVVSNPRSIWQRIQQAEYYLGIFLRKSFSVVNAIHVTPGAFSAYRKKFFEKYGGYEEGNITEDLEIALRIQKNDYIIENAADALVSTIAPRTFMQTLVQRRRWYVGLAKNLFNYRGLFGPKKGILGILVLPLAVISVIFTIYLTCYAILRSILQVKQELLFLESINFDLGNLLNINGYLFRSYIINLFYNIFSNPVFLITFSFLFFLFFYMYFAKKNVGFKGSLFFNLLCFVLLYAILFTFWWIVSFVYILLGREVVWRASK
jgi:cellulose synthase/poly-beta-1,6-N-acetylglucosamine synthase-like glycosyltransferase